jgi:hypothetical protein
MHSLARIAMRLRVLHLATRFSLERESTLVPLVLRLREAVAVVARTIDSQPLCRGEGQPSAVPFRSHGQ